MMLPHRLGQLTIQISFVFYMSMFVPQLLFNLRHRGVHGLNWLMHLILLTSCLCDSVYGISQHMPWQYYSVSLSGLVLLSLQHVQFWLYQREQLPPGYKPITALLALLAVVGVCAVLRADPTRKIFPILGGLAGCGYLTASLPQMLTNQRRQSTEGLSFLFVMFQTVGLLCDVISAYSLDWPLPNKIGAPISLLLQLVLLYQFYAYGYRKRRSANALTERTPVPAAARRHGKLLVSGS
jgi:uncharacterized protein with PQ loop repeat